MAKPIGPETQAAFDAMRESVRRFVALAVQDDFWLQDIGAFVARAACEAEGNGDFRAGLRRYIEKGRS